MQIKLDYMCLYFENTSRYQCLLHDFLFTAPFCCRSTSYFQRCQTAPLSSCCMLHVFFLCSGICTCSSPMTTFSRWRTGSSTQRPTRCPSSARAACRTKRRRRRRPPIKTAPTCAIVTDTFAQLILCTHSHSNIANTDTVQVPSLFRSAFFGLSIPFQWRMLSFYAVIVYPSRRGFPPAGTSSFVDNQDKHDFHEKSTFFFPSFLCEEAGMDGRRVNYGPYC